MPAPSQIPVRPPDNITVSAPIPPIADPITRAKELIDKSRSAGLFLTVWSVLLGIFSTWIH